MSRTFALFARVVLGSCLSVIPVGLTWSVEPPAVKATSLGGLTSYTAPSGDVFHAIGLRAKDLPAVKTARHHVVLIDTSASQFGEHRTHGQGVLQAFLRELPAADKVMLFAVDVQAERLTTEFVAANSAAVNDALAQLRQRTPLGATDMQAALSAALTAIPQDAAGTVLYLGDGMSTVNLLSSQTLKAALSDLRERQIPVSSFAVGPRRDLRLLGAIAQHTGGSVAIDEGRESKTPASNVAEAGKLLARTATASVLYPETLEVPGADLKWVSEQPLPLRADRETLVLARGIVAKGSTVTATGQLAGEAVRLQWPVSELRAEQGTAFVATAFQMSEKDNGLIPFAGRDLFTTAWNEFDQRLQWLTNEGNVAIARNRPRDAERIAKAIQQLDPESAQAKMLLSGGPRPKVRTVSLKQDKDADAADAASQPAGDKPSSGSLLGGDEFKKDASTGKSLILEEVDRIRVLGEKLKLEVSQAIQQARALGGTEPDTAIILLKRANGTVQTTTDAPIDLRQQLTRQLQGVIADVRSQKDVAAQKEIGRQEQIAIQEAEKRLFEKARLEDEKLENLIDRVRTALHDGFHGKDEAFPEAEAAAEAAVQMAPNIGVSVAARVGAEAAYQLNQAFRLRNERANKFLAVLEQVELSHIPFPDEPPVLFPKPQVWKDLTERRRQYASVDLHKSSPAERRIAAELDQPTDIAFSDTPLSDVVIYWAEYHNIPIILDQEALNDEAIPLDSPVTRTLTGVKLRSALKIVLQPLKLSYVIEDEVMKITTATKEAEKLQTRVYPVGDLVVILLPMQGGGQGGGQQQQGGGGGFGGGQQQGGGGGFGGGGGGNGGGFFNVPVNPFQRNAPAAPAFNNGKVDAAKKKLNAR